MEKYNTAEIRQGCLAMVIGCTFPENNWTIGKVVRVESVHKRGENAPDYMTTDFGKSLLTPEGVADDFCVVSCEGWNMKPRIWVKGMALALTKYLMPLGDNYSRADKYAEEEKPIPCSRGGIMDWTMTSEAIVSSSFAWHEIVDSEISFRVSRCPDSGAIIMVGGVSPNGEPHRLEVRHLFKAPHTNLGDALRAWGNHDMGEA